MVKYQSGVCSEPCSSLIRHLSLFIMYFWKILDFSALLSKILFTLWSRNF